MFFPDFQPDVFLINNCGQKVHSWTEEGDFAAGLSVYLTEDGNLIKGKRPGIDPSDVMLRGSGQGGIVELRDWDNNLLWEYELLSGNRRLHHDIEPLPNGNILMIAWEIISLEDAYDLGRDPETLVSSDLYDEFIYEVNPNTNDIVWEWKASNLLIQTFKTIAPNWVGKPSA